MADYKKLNEWLLINHERLHLETSRGSWASEWLNGYTDFRVSITLEGITVSGRGLDRNEELAFTKGAAEAIERYLCTKLGIHSNGVAVHTSKEDAFTNAKLELIERDHFLCHYLSNTPLNKIVMPEIKGIDIELIRSKLKQYNVEIDFYQMMPTRELQIIACFAKGGSRFGSILGLGCHFSQENACEKALGECLTNVVAELNENKFNSVTIDEFKSASVLEPNLHYKLNLNPSSFQFIGKILNDNNNTLVESKISLSEINCRELPIDNLLLKEAPIYAAIAEASGLQGMFYGDTLNEKVNIKRIREFTGNSIAFSEINTFPHPVG